MGIRMRMMKISRLDEFERTSIKSMYFKRTCNTHLNTTLVFLVLFSFGLVLSMFHDQIVDTLNLEYSVGYFVYSIRLNMMEFCLDLLKKFYPFVEEEPSTLDRAFLNLCKSRLENLLKIYNLHFNERIIVGRYIKYGMDRWIRVGKKPKLGAKVLDPDFGVVGVIDYCKNGICHIGRFKQGYTVSVEGKYGKFITSLVYRNDNLFVKFLDTAFNTTFLEDGATVNICDMDPDYMILKEMNLRMVGYISHPFVRVGDDILFPLETPKIESEYLIVLDLEKLEEVR